MVTKIQFYLSKRAIIWCEAEVNLFLDEFDGKLSVFWDEDINVINVDRIHTDAEINIRKLKDINHDRIYEAINDVVSNYSVEQFRTLENNAYENCIGI